MWSMNKEKKDKKTNIPEVVLEATSGGGQKRKKRDWTEERWKEKHLMEGTKKRKRTRSANTLVQKKMLRPCLQQLENYRGGNIWWRTRAEGGPEEAVSCSRAQSNIRETLRSQTHKHTHTQTTKLWDKLGPQLNNFTSFSALSQFFRERNQIKEKDTIMTKGTK